jgi:hypothetical protein
LERKQTDNRQVSQAVKCYTAINVNADARGLSRQLLQGIFFAIEEDWRALKRINLSEAPSAWKVSAVEYCQRTFGPVTTAKPSFRYGVI